MSESFSAVGFFVHTPLGPRKSGMPESVEMPAPVSATTRLADAIHSRTCLMTAGELIRFCSALRFGCGVQGAPTSCKARS
jgi:hypothetical protein